MFYIFTSNKISKIFYIHVMLNIKTLYVPFSKKAFLVTLNEWEWLTITLCLLSFSVWTFLVFRLLLLNRYTDLLQILFVCSMGNQCLVYKNGGATHICHGMMGNFLQILANCQISPSIKPQTRNHSCLVWRVPRGFSFMFVQIRLLSPIFTILINDLHKQYFDFSQTAAQILMKCGSYMHLSKVTQVCSN